MPIVKTISNDVTRVNATIYRVTGLTITFALDGTPDCVVTVQGFTDKLATGSVQTYQFKPGTVPANILTWIENRVVLAAAFSGGSVVAEGNLP